MKNLSFIKISITLGFVLLFVTFLPFSSNPVFYQPLVVKASSTENGQNDIKLNVNSKSLITGSTYSLKVYNLSNNHKVHFKSEDSSIVSVNKDGEITGEADGKTTIIVTVKNGFWKVATFECTVTVGPPAASVTFSKDELTIGVGKRRNLFVFLKPKNTVEDAKFSSSNESIAKVTSNGRVIAVSPGKATITATIANGGSHTCTIIVVNNSTDPDDE